MKENINYEWYKTFYYTALHLSFTKAAEALFVTQSSVSQTIKQLEKQLAVQLFSRSKRKIQLTEEGEILFLHVEQAIQHLSAAERKLADRGKGEITIGASDTLCKYLLLPYFKAFHRQYPHIKINIINQPSKATLKMIQEGLMDFGIVTVSTHHRFEGIALHPLKSYAEVCIVGEELYPEIGDRASLSDLVDYPLIALRSNTNTRRFLDEVFKARELAFEPEFEMLSVDLIKEMVRADLGIGFVMSETLDASETDLFTIKIEPELPKREIAFAISASLPLSETANLFMAFIKNLDAD